MPRPGRSLPAFLLGRTLQAVPLLVGLLTLVFFLSRLLPGDAGTLFLSPTVSPEAAERLRVQFGLDRPVPVQYILWIRALLEGNLGLSFSFNAPVREILARVFPNTIILAIPALFLEMLLAVGLVAVAKRHPGSTIDRLLSRGTLVVYALPTFWLGFILVMVFSYWLGVFPSAYMWSAGSEGSSLVDLVRHLVLPSLTLAIPGAAGLARYLASTVSDVEKEEYVLAGTSMGLTHWTVFRRYILKNSLAPFISFMGTEIGGLLAGALVTETLFAWPGMGRLAVMAIFARDYPLILGCTLLAGVVVIVGNLMADILQAILDPRVRLE